MNPTLLIHAIVRQTMVLIAVLATAAGRRTPLANIADQVFATLVKELGEQGVGSKVIADMLGMALRTYHRRAARMSESDTEKGRSLWEAVLTFLREGDSVLRAEVLLRFPHDNEAVVRSVLRDLVDSGLVYQTGRGDSTAYRAADPAEFSAAAGTAAVDQLLLVAIHQHGPLSAAALRATFPLDEAAFLAATERLVADGLIVVGRIGEETSYRCEQVVIPLGAAAGWEAAVFDHYQAMVTALVTKLRLGKRRADLADKVGGSTFVFHLRPEHPMADEVLGYLRTMREAGMALRKRLDEYDGTHPPPAGSSVMRVVSYVGQSVQAEESDDE